MLADPDRSDDFRLLERELYLTATDLDTAERVILGKGEWADVPISTAVAASAALPMVYEPVELRGRQFIDGGIRSTTNVDIAVEQGAKFIVVVNPLVPFINDFGKQIPTDLRRPGAARLRHGLRRDRQPGLPASCPTTASTAPSRTGRSKYPGVDIILIEPEPDDELMFGTSIMDYSARLGSPSTASSRSRCGSPATTSATARSPSATGSRSRPAASATCSTRSSARPRRPRPGAGCSSRRPRRCSQPRPEPELRRASTRPPPSSSTEPRSRPRTSRRRRCA